LSPQIYNIRIQILLQRLNYPPRLILYKEWDDVFQFWAHTFPKRFF